MPKAEARARPPIDPEELAAFIDGRLEGDRRRLMIERLADDEDAYDLYDEVIRVREELRWAADGGAAEATAVVEPQPRRSVEGSPGEPSSVVRLPERTSSSRFGWSGAGWLAAAAALAVAVLVGWLLLRPRGPVAGSSELLARFESSTLGPHAAAVALETLGRTFRSGDPLPPEERAASFRLGVRAFDLALAAEARDAKLTADWFEEIDRLLDAVSFGFTYQGAYQQLGQDLAAGASPQSLRRRIANAEADLDRDLDQPYFAFGRWVEAVRIAAVTGDRRFLASRPARRPLRHFLESRPSPAVAERLATVSRELERGAASADLEAVAEALEAVIEDCADGAVCFGAPDPL